MSMVDVINEFRERNGKSRLENIHHSYNCEAHCWAMVSAGGPYHAEPCYLHDWGEAIAMGSFLGNWGELERWLIFDNLGGSAEHRNLLLNSNILVYGIIMFKGNVYLTVRGR